MFKHDPNVITEIINDIVNDRADCSIFSEMIVIPIYKASKKGLVSDCNSFRSVCLGETLYKLAEGCYIMYNRKMIEESMGESQIGYKEGKGTNVGAKDL